jgi:hypothetical protein
MKSLQQEKLSFRLIHRRRQSLKFWQERKNMKSGFDWEWQFLVMTFENQV